MRFTTFAASTCAAAGMFVMAFGAPGAQAATTPSPSTVTFSVTSGSLSIAEDNTAAVSLGAVTAGTAALGALTPTTVTDNRNSSTTITWNDVVTISGFTGTAAGTGNDLVLASAMKVDTGVAALTVTGIGTATGIALAAGVASGATLVAMTASTGNTSTTFTPGLNLTVPITAFADTYTGTIVQTVL